ncbi:hypothetical protein CHARACLAT_022620 [Characodon lateralis]|uniref:Uncharacterized protein n=1 Tax=Characodon lateralis TaxID=208331 RepID=A0ABU7E318_9TELE|nr:hypothetical protein [Characodon lateralis]
MSSQNWKRVIVPGAQQPAFLKIRNKGEKRGQAVHMKKAMLLIQLPIIIKRENICANDPTSSIYYPCFVYSFNLDLNS